MVELEISQHADVRRACDDLYKIEKAAAELGFEASALSRARDLMNTMSARVSLLETRADDPAVVELVRAARIALGHMTCGMDGNWLTDVDEVDVLRAAVAPFQHIKDAE